MLNITNDNSQEKIMSTE